MTPAWLVLLLAGIVTIVFAVVLFILKMLGLVLVGIIRLALVVGPVILLLVGAIYVVEWWKRNHPPK